MSDTRNVFGLSCHCPCSSFSVESSTACVGFVVRMPASLYFLLVASQLPLLSHFISNPSQTQSLHCAQALLYYRLMILSPPHTHTHLIFSLSRTRRRRTLLAKIIHPPIHPFKSKPFVEEPGLSSSSPACLACMPNWTRVVPCNNLYRFILYLYLRIF